MSLLIGLMSGTSADCIDAALVRFNDERPELISGYSSPVPPAVRTAIIRLTQPDSNELDRAARLDATVARLFAEAALNLISGARIDPARISAIGSHGQTIRHTPAGPEPYTVQIGNPSLIAELTGITTIADFRRRDMAAGGQGAPLAPAFHAAFLSHGGENRAIVNIGGMANVTFLAKDRSVPVGGFDTGPGNALLDGWVQRHLSQPMDREGAWAASGQALPELLERLLQDGYFALDPPKSTGREHFNLDWLEQNMGNWTGTVSPRDIQATLAELTVISIARTVLQRRPQPERVLVCGGGVHNPVIMAGLERHLGVIPVESTATHGIDPDYMEAMGFAWLAKRTLERRPGNLPDVTGARGLRVLGGIYPA